MNRPPAVVSLLLAVVAALLCLLLGPAVVNGDGLGYLKAAPTDVLYPGHLAYLPLLRLLARLAGAADSLALLRPAQALSVVATAGAVLCLHRAACLLVDEVAATVAAAGLAVSFAVVQAGADVETYAPALLAMCFTTWAAAARAKGSGWGWLILAGLGLAAAALLHVENVLFGPAAALLAARRRQGSGRPAIGDGVAVLLLGGAVVLGAYLFAFTLRHDTPASAIRWVLGASHGYAHPLRLSTPAVALYGMAKGLVFSPYPVHSSWPAVLVASALGTGALALLLWLARRPGRPTALGRAVAVAWFIPYTVVGVAFFASDNERWIFLLPPAWLIAGAGATTSRRARRVAAGLLVGLAALDLALGLPVARDNAIRARAEAVSAHLQVGDLIVSPGHSWDEYIGFYQRVVLDRYPMIYFCGLLGGGEAMRQELGRRVAAARRRGARVFFARLDEPVTADGWKELVLFGITPSRSEGFLPPGRRVELAPGLIRLDPW